MKRINPFRMWNGAIVPEWLLVRSEISPGAKLCYGRLMRFAGADGFCNPRNDTIAAAIGVHSRMVRNYLTELKRFGLIEWQQRGLGRSNVYWFLDHRWMDFTTDEPTAAEIEALPLPGNGPPDDSITDPDRQDIATQGLATLDRQDIATLNGKILPDIKRVIGKKKERVTNVTLQKEAETGKGKEEERKNRAREADRLQAIAEEIYSHYPRKVAKRKAIAAIVAAIKRGANPKELRRRTIVFAGFWRDETDKTFCPHPTTWYNGDRYNDSPETWVPKKRNGGKLDIQQRKPEAYNYAEW